MLLVLVLHIQHQALVEVEDAQVKIHLANHPQAEERESQDQILCIHAHAAQKASCFLSFAFPVHLLT